MHHLDVELKKFTEQERAMIIENFTQLREKLAERGITAEIKAGEIIYTSKDGQVARKEDARNLICGPSSEAE